MDEQLQEDLVALAKGELEPARQAELEALAERDAAVRAELEQIRGTLRAVQRIGVVEPSAEFRVTLEKRIRDSVAHKERSGRMQRPGSTAMRLPGVVSPGARESASRIDAQGVGESARAARPGSLSVRLAERRETGSPFAWLRYVALAAAMVLVTLTLSHFLAFPAVAPEHPSATEVALKRWVERKDAPRWDRVLRGDSLELVEVPDGTELVLMPHLKADAREECLVAYTPDQIEALRANPALNAQQLEAALARSFKATVEHGTVSLPPLLRARHLGDSGAPVVVLRCPGRFELWSEPVLRRYLRDEPRMEAVPAPGADLPETPPGVPSTGKAPAADDRA